MKHLSVIVIKSTLSFRGVKEVIEIVIERTNGVSQDEEGSEDEQVEIDEDTDRDYQHSFVRYYDMIVTLP